MLYEVENGLETRSIASFLMAEDVTVREYVFPSLIVCIWIEKEQGQEEQRPPLDVNSKYEYSFPGEAETLHGW